jgi:hypothetical protein
MKSLIKIMVLLLGVSSAAYAEETSVLSRVSLDQATRQISGMAHNTILSASTEIIDDKEVHIIKALGTDGWIVFYKIDAETGAIVS